MRHPLLLHHVQNLKSKIYLKFYMFRKGIERMLGEYKVLSIVILELRVSLLPQRFGSFPTVFFCKQGGII